MLNRMEKQEQECGRWITKKDEERIKHKCANLSFFETSTKRAKGKATKPANVLRSVRDEKTRTHTHARANAKLHTQVEGCLCCVVLGVEQSATRLHRRGAGPNSGLYPLLSGRAVYVLGGGRPFVVSYALPAPPSTLLVCHAQREKGRSPQSS